MKRWSLKNGCWLVIALLSVIPAALRAATPQKAGPPTLAELLQRLQENLEQYDATIPSFFCDEQVVAAMRQDSVEYWSGLVVTDSTFRLKRVDSSGGRVTLQESHEVKRVNGRPATGDSVSGPSYLRGAFSNGLALVSLSQQICMSYTLEPAAPNRPKDPYIIDFASLPGDQRPINCLMHEDVSGRVLIDPLTTQIKRMEFRAPHHLIVPAGHLFAKLELAPIYGQWDVSVEYAPILLDGRRFWLPSKIYDKMASRPADIEWWYNAIYRNYHKMVVTSRILPFNAALAP